jgi:hypothetical protein
LAIELLALSRLELGKSIAQAERCQHDFPEAIIVPYGTTRRKLLNTIGKNDGLKN